MIPFPFAANASEQGRRNHLRPLLTLSETTQLSAFLVRKLSTAFFNSQNGDKIGMFPAIWTVVVVVDDGFHGVSSVWNNVMRCSVLPFGVKPL